MASASSSSTLGNQKNVPSEEDMLLSLLQEVDGDAEQQRSVMLDLLAGLPGGLTPELLAKGDHVTPEELLHRIDQIAASVQEEDHVASTVLGEKRGRAAVADKVGSLGMKEITTKPGGIKSIGGKNAKQKERRLRKKMKNAAVETGVESEAACQQTVFLDKKVVDEEEDKKVLVVPAFLPSTGVETPAQEPPATQAPSTKKTLEPSSKKSVETPQTCTPDSSPEKRTSGLRRGFLKTSPRGKKAKDSAAPAVRPLGLAPGAASAPLKTAKAQALQRKKAPPPPDRGHPADLLDRLDDLDPEEEELAREYYLKLLQEMTANIHERGDHEHFSDYPPGGLYPDDDDFDDDRMLFDPGMGPEEYERVFGGAMGDPYGGDGGTIMDMDMYGEGGGHFADEDFYGDGGYGDGGYGDGMMEDGDVMGGRGHDGELMQGAATRTNPALVDGPGFLNYLPKGVDLSQLAESEKQDEVAQKVGSVRRVGGAGVASRGVAAGTRGSNENSLDDLLEELRRAGEERTEGDRKGAGGLGQKRTAGRAGGRGERKKMLTSREAMDADMDRYFEDSMDQYFDDYMMDMDDPFDDMGRRKLKTFL